jgi:hypothetical protein
MDSRQKKLCLIPTTNLGGHIMTFDTQTHNIVRLKM